MLKYLYIIIGVLFLLIATIGIVVPGLPTTPFLLITAWFFVKSSDKLYNKLVQNKIFGRYINTYRKNKGIHLRTKIYSICIMWIMVSFSIYFFNFSTIEKLIIACCGLIGTIVMGFIIKTIRIN